MKIAVPVANGKLAAHFGHCEQFAFLEVGGDGELLPETQYATPPPHEPGVLPAWLHTQGITHVIAGEMGQRALQLFQSHGIRVVVGATSDDPVASARSFLAGTLELTDNFCDH